MNTPLAATLVAVLALGARVPSVDAAFVRHGPAIVGVRAGPPGEEVATTGFFLTSSGLIATVTVPVDEATVTLPDGAVRKARVVARAEVPSREGPARDGVLTLLEIERQPDEVFAALAVGKGAPSAPYPAWWLALTFVDGRAVPALGGVRRADGPGRLRLDLPAGPGAPVLVKDEVVGVVVQRLDRTSCVAQDVRALVALAQQVAQRR